jgi:ribokinase
VLNLAPVTTRDRTLIAAADPLIVNETEAADVLGVPRDTLLDELLDAFAAAVERGLAVSAVVTLGDQGSLLVADGERTMVASPPVPEMPEVVDTTGAGDAFCGTLAAALAEGETLIDAACLASAAGSLAVRSRGAAASYAGRDEIRRCAEMPAG